MPFETSWYVADRVVYEKFSGFVSLDEINEVVRLGETFQQQAGDQALHFIADITELKSVPLNIVQLRNIQLKPPPKKGMTVIVASPNYSVNNVATFFGKLMRTVFGWRFKMFRTIDEAYTHLQEVDPTLRDLQPIMSAHLNDEAVPESN